MTEIDYEQLAAAQMRLMMTTYKAPSGTPSLVTAHGNGGLFSPAGLSPGIANAMLLPNQGLASMLPSRVNNMMNPLRGIFTGVTATTGAEGAGRCDDPPTAGLSKICTVTRPFGWIGRSSREMRLDMFGRQTNRGEFTDHMLIGNPYAGPQVAEIPVPGGITPQMVTNEIGKLLFEVSVALNRDMAHDIYTGNPANNSGSLGNSGREYYNGLDILINTGYIDAITAQACPASDSIVEDFNNVNITTNPDLVVRTFASILRRLNYIATFTGLNPVKFAIAMHHNLFYELTEIWPCVYLTNRCTLVGTQSRVNVSAKEQEDMRNDMRGNMQTQTGQFLWIDGQQIPVIIDGSIVETSPAIPGEFASDVYFVPLSIRGGGGRFAPVSEGGNFPLYFDYFNFDAPGGTMDGARAMAPLGSFQTTGGGRWLWKKDEPVNLCVLVKGWTSPALNLETPYLAARFTNLAYTPIAQVRSPFTDSAYFADGGRTDFLGYGASFYGPTT